MGFPLVPKSVTLNDPERPNGRVVCVISPYLLAFWDLLRYILRKKCSPKNLDIDNISLMAIFAYHPKRGR